MWGTRNDRRHRIRDLIDRAAVSGPVNDRVRSLDSALASSSHDRYWELARFEHVRHDHEAWFSSVRYQLVGSLLHSESPNILRYTRCLTSCRTQSFAGK